MNRIASASLPLFLLASTALAQVRESVTVQVVEVPVYVTSGGEPVTTLTRENFRLFANGKPQSIDYFDQIDFATMAPERAHDPRQRRLYMLAFDLNSSLNDLHRAQKAALKLIDDAAENHSFAVATLGHGGRGVIVPFTRDGLALRYAIRNLRISGTGDPLHLALTPGERGGEVGRPERINDPRLAAISEPDYDALTAISDVIYELGELAIRLGGMEGYRHVVLLSRGFDTVALHGARTAHSRSDIRIGPLSSLRDLPTSGTTLVSGPNAELLGQLRYMYEKFAKAGVFLDAIDTAGLRPMQTSLDNEALYTLTRDTGGTVIDRRNDLTHAMQLLIDRQRVVYVLGFRPDGERQGTNRINVKLVGGPRGANVSFRPLYSTVVDPLDNSDRLRLADIVMNDIPQNGVTTTARADGSAVELEIPGPEVLAHAVLGTVGAEVMFYVVSGHAVVAYRTKKVNIDVDRAGAALQERPLRVRETFDLPPGQYTAKILVRIDGSGALGLAKTDLEVK